MGNGLGEFTVTVDPGHWALELIINVTGQRAVVIDGDDGLMVSWVVNAGRKGAVEGAVGDMVDVASRGAIDFWTVGSTSLRVCNDVFEVLPGVFCAAFCVVLAVAYADSDGRFTGEGFDPGRDDIGGGLR